MFSPQRITKVTAIALAAGAIAAPAAAAAPVGGALVRHAQLTQSAPAAASAPTPLTYARQDKQAVPSSPSPASVNSSPTAAPTATPSGGFDWGDAGIGAAGGLALSIVGIGGALALSGRRTRRTVGSRTSAVAAG
jgi:hypothetical protein